MAKCTLIHTENQLKITLYFEDSSRIVQEHIGHMLTHAMTMSHDGIWHHVLRRTHTSQSEEKKL